MNLNDRVALILGRAIIRAEEATDRAERAQAEVLAIREKIEELTADSPPTPPGVTLP